MVETYKCRDCGADVDYLEARTMTATDVARMWGAR